MKVFEAGALAVPVLHVIIALTPVLLVFTTAYIYRSFFPKALVKRAIDIVAEYRMLESRARSKREIKKLRSLRPDYLRARRYLLKSVMTNFLLLTLFYIAGGLTIVSSYPVISTPIGIPFITVATDEGILLMPTLLIYFFMFLYAAMLFRDMLV